MKRALSVLIFLFLTHVFHLSAKVDEKLVVLLDDIASKQSYYQHLKEYRIDSLKRCYYTGMVPEAVYQLNKAIYDEYFYYRYDSATCYVQKDLLLAQEMHNDQYIHRCQVQRSVLLSIAGLYAESIENLKLVHREHLGNDYEWRYYLAYCQAYRGWTLFANEPEFVERYQKKELQYLDTLRSMKMEDPSLHIYFSACYHAKRKEFQQADALFKEAMKYMGNSKLRYYKTMYYYAQMHRLMGNNDLYEEYLIKAVIESIKSQFRGVDAMHELALLFYQQGRQEHAEFFLRMSLENATFYNDRLQLMKAARDVPRIMDGYQKELTAKQQRTETLAYVLAGCLLMLALMLAWLLLQMRQNIKQRQRLFVLNKQMLKANAQLTESILKHDRYTSLFMDLCAAYIEKLHNYQNFVKRKVKAKQTDDLLHSLNATRMTDTDAKEFFINFDTAFLRLYPNFIKAFNALLREDEAIVPHKGEGLTTELRIFALIRLGVKDSSKIATLLFYSPQTIYNYRSSVRNKAIRKETFEKEVENLQC